MAERGVDIAGRPTKSLTRFARTRFDRVITLCDKVREICPEFPGAPIAAHWSIADPAAAGDSDKATYAAFQHVADEIEGRVALLLADLRTRPTGKDPPWLMPRLVNVRYLVDDVAACRRLLHPALRLHRRHLESGVRGCHSREPAAPAVRPAELGRPGDDAMGNDPVPGGWNRIHLIVDDLDREIARLTEEGVRFRNEVVTGPGGAQVLAVDPSGNLVELFQPAAAS